MPVRKTGELNLASDRSSANRVGPGATQKSPLIAIVSSRLGRPIERYEEWFARLELQAFRTRESNSTLILVEGTTTYPWLKQAVSLYGIPSVELQPSDEEDRDALAIASADRVIALHVRPGGNIFRALQEKLLAHPNQTDVWVSVDIGSSCEVQKLMDLGAVGWYREAARPFTPIPDVQGTVEGCTPFVSVNGLQTERAISDFFSMQATDVDDASPWLVHCTRGRSGPLPGQTAEAWSREVLLGGRTGRAWSASEVLEEIVRGRLLRGNPQTKHGEPVVCFSAVPLNELLSRRAFRSHRGRWDYEPYGIAIQKRALQRAGALPVEYRESSELKRLQRSSCGVSGDLWRYQALGKTFDWREEKEWRVRGSVWLDHFSSDELFVFTADPDSATRLRCLSLWPIIRTSSTE